MSFFSPPRGPHVVFWYNERLPLIDQIIEIRENPDLNSIRRWFASFKNPLGLTRDEFTHFRRDGLRRHQIISEFRRLRQKFQTEIYNGNLLVGYPSKQFTSFDSQMRENLHDLEKAGLVYSWEVDSAICDRFPEF